MSTITVRGRTPRDIFAAVDRRRRPLERALHRHLLRRPAKVRCPVCGWSGVRLASSYRPRRPNRLCPACLSSERYRALELLLRRRGPVPPGTRLLEVAPIDTVRPTAEHLGYTYASVDLSSAKAQVHADLCHLPFPDGAFDVVVCFHVLEHIVDDDLAVAELARIVGTSGEALVVVPVDRTRTETFEDPTMGPEHNERLYGQSDHVRIYGGDVNDRWRATGVELTEDLWRERFTRDVHAHAALSGTDDRFWIIRQPGPGSASAPGATVSRAT